jgi:uncharacterized protein
VIDIAQDVVVHAPPVAVWPVLSDPRAIVECIPGAALTEVDGPSFRGMILVKFGPMRAQFSGSGICEFDESGWTGSLRGRGRDGRGATKFQATASFRLLPAQGGSRIVVSGGIDLSGPLASVVEAGAQSVVAELVTEFAQRLSALCTDIQASSSVLEPPAQLGGDSGTKPAGVAIEAPAVGTAPPKAEAISVWVILRAVARAGWRFVATRLKLRR